MSDAMLVHHDVITFMNVLFGFVVMTDLIF